MLAEQEFCERVMHGMAARRGEGAIGAGDAATAKLATLRDRPGSIRRGAAVHNSGAGEGKHCAGPE